MGTVEQDLKSAGHGDRRAFARVYDDTVPYAYRLVRCRVEGTANAQAMLIQAYRQLWAQAPYYDETAMSARVWVLRVVDAHTKGRTKTRTPDNDPAPSPRKGRLRPPSVPRDDDAPV
ncbi:MAG TPA: hypothetical protein VFJ19_02925 [Nocardioidaceae bacterium]|nr:hypothetical protein [Nocardioidaceae bacterium]